MTCTFDHYNLRTIRRYKMSFSSSSSDYEECNIVLDNGSSSISCGFVGGESPRAVFPNIIGKPRYRKCMIGCDSREYYIGDEAQIYRGYLSLQYPMKHGIVTDWDAMEKVWNHTFYSDLRIDPPDHKILISDAILNPKVNREKTVELMFETFGFPGLYLANAFNLALYSSGRGSGIVVDIGDGVTQIVPVWQGYTVLKAWNRINIAGSDLTQYLMTLLNQRGNCFTTSAEYEIVRNIKEKRCYVANDFDKEMQTSAENLDLNKKYKLPDGQFIDIGDERFRCPEVLFRPDMIGSECLGIHELTYDTLMKCDIDLRRDLYYNIILNGGSTMFDGFQERLEKEISSLIPPRMKAKVVAPCERKYSVWIGGSILGSLASTNHRWWLLKSHYEEYGAESLSKRIFSMI